jgi:hypothetical protein
MAVGSFAIGASWWRLTHGLSRTHLCPRCPGGLNSRREAAMALWVRHRPQLKLHHPAVITGAQPDDGRRLVLTAPLNAHYRLVHPQSARACREPAAAGGEHVPWATDPLRPTPGSDGGLVTPIAWRLPRVRRRFAASVRCARVAMRDVMSAGAIQLPRPTPVMNRCRYRAPRACRMISAVAMAGRRGSGACGESEAGDGRFTSRLNRET